MNNLLAISLLAIGTLAASSAQAQSPTREAPSVQTGSFKCSMQNAKMEQFELAGEYAREADAAAGTQPVQFTLAAKTKPDLSGEYRGAVEGGTGKFERTVAKDRHTSSFAGQLDLVRYGQGTLVIEQHSMFSMGGVSGLYVGICKIDVPIESESLFQ